MVDDCNLLMLNSLIYSNTTEYEILSVRLSAYGCFRAQVSRSQVSRLSIQNNPDSNTNLVMYIFLLGKGGMYIGVV